MKLKCKAKSQVNVKETLLHSSNLPTLKNCMETVKKIKLTHKADMEGMLCLTQIFLMHVVSK